MSHRTLVGFVQALQRRVAMPNLHPEGKAELQRILLMLAAIDEGSSGDIVALFHLAKPEPSDMEDGK